MKSGQIQNNILALLMEELSSSNDDKMKFLLEIVYNTLMITEREIALQASHYERSCERLGYANGFKDKTLNSRIGKLKLNIPQTRGLAFYPRCLDKGLRTEKEMISAIAEMYITGVSTRKVKKITKELCGLEISSTQVSRMTKELDEEFERFRNRPLGFFAYITFDATYVNVRHNGTVRKQATLIAYGVNIFGRREILGVSMSFSEAEIHWKTFFNSLVKRGLTGIKLITSDAHPGLQAAMQSVFPGAPWQRCQFHMSKDAQEYAPRKHMRQEIASSMRDIFNCPSIETAELTIRNTVKQFEITAPKFTKWLNENILEGLTCLSFPQDHRKKIRTSNPLERVNREIKRRTKVAVLFPNDESALRLVTALLKEINEAWVNGKQYLNMDEYISSVKMQEYKSHII